MAAVKLLATGVAIAFTIIDKNENKCHKIEIGSTKLRSFQVMSLLLTPWRLINNIR